jgi:outer membrane immunogenic protein
MRSGAAMKRLAAAITTVTLIGTSAFAADMAVKAPPPAPAPVYNWTGWYVGVNAGASFGNVKTDFNVAPYTFTSAGAFVTFPGIAGSDRTYPSGFMGGGQIGYNWQFSPIWVVGFEADFQGALERDSSNLSNPLNGNPIVGGAGNMVVATALTNYTTNIDWFGTVRLRAGYLWGNGNVFSYVTGGLAYGEVKINGTNTVSGLVNGLPFSISDAFGHSQVNTGWVVGYGTEGVIDFWGARNWTWKIESLYMDLGHVDTTGVTTGAGTTPGLVLTGAQVTTHSHFTDGILRAGLNYKFY